mgnify:CR=1 FL=1
MNNNPFDNQNTTVAIYLEPYLNNVIHSYHNIITLSAMPNGPIANMVSTLRTFPLSPFQTNSPFSSNNCSYVLFRHPQNQSHSKKPDAFLNEHDIPSIISYLQSNNYFVDTHTSTMLFQSPATSGNHTSRGNRKLICMFRYTL